MKPLLALKTATALALAALAGCGQTGPLYLPHPPARPASAPAGTPALPAVPPVAPAPNQ